jgi:hypothetical protein
LPAGADVSGHMSFNANLPCRSCSIPKERLNEPDTIYKYQRYSKQMELEARLSHNAKQLEQLYGMRSEFSPLFFLITLNSIFHFNCYLHWGPLGLCNTQVSHHKEVLNAGGIREWVTLLHQTSTLLKVSKIHRIRSFPESKAKLNGDDVALLMDAWTETLPKVMTPSNLKQNIREELNAMAPEVAPDVVQEIYCKQLIYTWNQFVIICHRLMKPTYTLSYHKETWKDIVEFKDKFSKCVLLNSNIPKCHQLEELWVDMMYAGPCYLFSSDVFESRNKDYHK